MRRLARRLTADAHRADDAVQETWLAAHGGGSRNRRGFLATILRNRLRQDARSGGRRAGREEEVGRRRGDDSPSASETAQRLERSRLLLNALDELEEPYRSVVTLRYLDDLPPRKVAARLGVPVKTVHTRLERGLARLRARLDSRFDGDRDAWLRVLAPFGWTLGDALVATITGAAMTTKLTIGVLALAVGASAVLVAPDLLGASRPAESSEPTHAVPASPGGSPREPEPVESSPALETRSSLDGPAPQAARDGEEPVSGPATGEAWVEVHVAKARSGQPLSGAAVQVMRTDEEHEKAGRSGAEGRTDQRGLVRLRAPLGAPVRIAVQPRDADEPVRPGGRVVEAFHPDETRRVQILLEHGLEGRFYGQVVDDRTDEDLAGAVFVRRSVLGRDVDVLEHVEGLAPDELDGYDFGRADAHGAFVARFPTWAPPVVEVHHPGYRPEQVELGRREQSAAAPFLVRLKRDGLVTVQLRTALGSPEEYAVRFEASGFESTLVSCTADGTAEIDRLPPEVELVGEVWNGGQLVWRTPEPVVLEQGEDRRLTWSVGAGTLVDGVVVDDAGRPVAGHVVLAVPAEARAVEREGRRLLEGNDEGRALARATTDASGRFELGEIAAGDWWVGLAPTGDRGPEAPAPAALGLRLEPGELTRRVELETPLGLYITGSLTGPGGSTFGYAAIQASPQRADGSASAQVERDGAFRVGPLLPGPYRLWVWGSGFMTSGRYDVEAGDSIELRLGEQNAIGGRVLDGDGRAFEAHVSLIVPRGSLGMGTSGKALGAFLFADLPPATYALAATTPDGRVAVLGGIELGDGDARTDLELELREGGSIRVDFEGPPGFRCAIYSQGVKIEDSSMRGSNFAIVPAGDALVEVYGRDSAGEDVRRERHVEAIPGRVQEVKFVVEP